MGLMLDKETADALDFDLMAVMQDFMEAHPEFGGPGTGGSRQARRMRRRTLAAVGIPLAAALVAGAVVAVRLAAVADQHARRASTEKPATVVAERTTLTSNLLLNGNLTLRRRRRPARAAAARSPGCRGRAPWSASARRLYEVDGRPVIAVARLPAVLARRCGRA